MTLGWWLAIALLIWLAFGVVFVVWLWWATDHAPVYPHDEDK